MHELVKSIFLVNVDPVHIARSSPEPPAILSSPESWGGPNSALAGLAFARLISSEPILVVKTPFETLISTPTYEIYQ